MKPKRQEHEGHRIELRPREGQEAELALFIDDILVRHGQLPNGKYFLHKYAFDWRDDLVDLARRFIDHRRRVEETRGPRASGRGGN